MIPPWLAASRQASRQMCTMNKGLPGLPSLRHGMSEAGWLLVAALTDTCHRVRWCCPPPKTDQLVFCIEIQGDQVGLGTLAICRLGQ